MSQDKKYIRIQQRVDTRDNWENVNSVPLLEREIGYEKETGLFKIGELDENGREKHWNDLSYASSSVGKKSDIKDKTSGEIFNDYENNEAIGKYSHVSGMNSKALGEISFAHGENAQAIGTHSIAIGNNTFSGSKGFFFKAIDTINKKIFLTNIQPTRENPPIILDQNYNQNDYIENDFETPAYNTETNNEIAIIMNTYYIGFGCYITAINKNVITYQGNLPFSTIEIGDARSYRYTFSVPKQPTIGNTDIGYYSFSEGYETYAAGRYSHVEGYNTVATAYGHAEGNSTIAGGSAHAEGQNTKALGPQAHAEGLTTTASGINAHAEGQITTASGNNAHTEGNNTTASGICSHAEGYNCQVSGEMSHAEGNGNTVTASYSHAEGAYSTVNGLYNHSEGKSNTIYGAATGAHAEGISNTINTGDASHAEGTANVISGTASHIEGYKNVGNAISYSHIEGNENSVNANCAHVEGRKHYITSNAEASHVEGHGNQVTAKYSHTEGHSCFNYGELAHVEGYGAQATTLGKYAHVEGRGTIVNNTYQHVQGKWNEYQDENNKPLNYAHIVGNGTNNENRSNAHTLDWEGNAWFAGTVEAQGIKVPTFSIELQPTTTTLTNDDIEYYYYDLSPYLDSKYLNNLVYDLVISLSPLSLNNTTVKDYLQMKEQFEYAELLGAINETNNILLVTGDNPTLPLKLEIKAVKK